MVAEGLLRREDKEGNDAADAAADFGGFQHLEVVVGARRNLLRVEKEWHPRMLVLHRFMAAIDREALNHGDAATSCLATVKVPLIQFLAGVSGHFSRHRDRLAQLQLCMVGFWRR